MEIGIGVAGGCGGKGGGAGPLVSSALVYEDGRCNRGYGSDGSGFTGGDDFGACDGSGFVGGGISCGNVSLATAAAASGTKPDAI